MKNTTLSAAVLLGSAACQAAAATTLSPVIVTATRTAQTADQTLASVTVISRNDIERSQAQLLPELLRGVPGLALSNNGGPGKATSVFLRGTNSDHVLVLIDGIKVGSATAGTTAFQDLPLSQIERIEIVRGPRSSLYGSEAIGGVIQIFTRKGQGELRPRASVTLGSHQTRSGDFGLSAGGEAGWFNAGFSALNTEGINACDPAAATAFAGCFADEPDRDGYRNRAASLRAGRRLSDDTEVAFNWLRTEGDSEFDGNFQNESESGQQVLGVSLDSALSEHWQTRLQLGRSWDESDNFKDGDFSSRFDTRRDSVSWQNDIAVGSTALLTLGLDFQHDEVSSTEDFDVTERDNSGAFAQYQFMLGRHELIAALRHDDNEQFGSQGTGSLAWGYDTAYGVRLTASYGTAFKAPSFNELYFPFFGNPDLAPEESETLEFGIAAPLGQGNWALNLYETRIDDLIAFDASIMAPANVESARIRGLELVLQQPLGDWDLNGNLTLLDPEDRDTGNRLPRRARQSLQLDLDRDFGRYGVGASVHAVGKRYDDLANSRELDGYATLDLRASYRFAADWTLGARAVNLFDRDYETASFYEQEGRSFYATLSYAPAKGLSPC
ncbi:TonB-dependent vitamin B12 receptor [Marinobacterium aestuariivivens]|uniref:TonB-dependent vitamin B12 receptor n=1 Tax=Marinobacterium aestuariivivens TaxID=1698799 RepID=A0ABW2A445_9GAMM